MGFFDGLISRVKSDLGYKAGSEITKTISKGASKAFGKNDSNESKCPKCKQKIKKGLKFCDKCGAKLTSSCPKCGLEYPLGKKFCSSCGEKLVLK